MSKKFSVSLLVSLLVLISSPKTVQAVTIPNFPTCANPQGTVQAYYGTGTHGVPGTTQTNTGSDTVYSIDNNNQLMQCFCAADTSYAIQTNWWKASDLSEDDIKVLENQGWVFVPDGSAWGLDAVAYLAFNIGYSCRGTGSSSSSGGNSNNSGGGTGGGGQVSGASTQNSLQGVLGLAFTGDIVFLSSVLGLGIVLLLAGTVLYKKGS